jgi:hypothetical protein
VLRVNRWKRRSGLLPTICTAKAAIKTGMISSIGCRLSNKCGLTRKRTSAMSPDQERLTATQTRLLARLRFFFNGHLRRATLFCNPRSPRQTSNDVSRYLTHKGIRKMPSPLSAPKADERNCRRLQPRSRSWISRGSVTIDDAPHACAYRGKPASRTGLSAIAAGLSYRVFAEAIASSLQCPLDSWHHNGAIGAGQHGELRCSLEFCQKLSRF